MESSKVISTDKPTVVIEVNPQVIQDTVIFVDGHAGGKNHNTALKGFFKAQPKALGTVQIMIGAMIFILGIVLTSNVYSYSAILDYSGISYWGSLIYISAGSLSVAAQNKHHPCVVKASLGINVFSAITAGMAILLMGIQLALISMDHPSLYVEVKTLPRMESSKFMSTDKATVIIQVNPQVKQDNVICDDEQQARGAYHNTALKGFFKAQPKALGTVQIMIGVVIFLFGIVCTTNINTFELPIFIFSGITYWGSLIYISAGSLSVAAQKKLHLCVLKASLGMNVISAITAGISIILMGADIGITSSIRPNCYKHDCINPQGFGSGILGILLVFSILQLIISIFISAFACKATNSTDSTVINVAINQGY
ncbi:uncharacterized protein [Sinocyclocheilus grahami]|uniref:uncharacterized protein n=1 Tax=Sinocyclocheilus grahami TaxID=75366 RepID=UPI0007AD68A8|nr:PREDICTED: uncharacterized protein LOC107596924 [Sinocyclocheilus grahami]